VPSISEFSNYGPWVACSALGDNVKSTFLHVDMPVEDDDGPGGDKDFTSNSWASWNGTSFAAPKVVAAIASRVAGGMTPRDAWADLTSGLVPDGNLGVRARRRLRRSAGAEADKAGERFGALAKPRLRASERECG
jgi:hypothetical protein